MANQNHSLRLLAMLVNHSLEQLHQSIDVVGTPGARIELGATTSWKVNCQAGSDGRKTGQEGAELGNRPPEPMDEDQQLQWCRVLGKFVGIGMPAVKDTHAGISRPR